MPISVLCVSKVTPLWSPPTRGCGNMQSVLGLAQQTMLRASHPPRAAANCKPSSGLALQLLPQEFL